MIMHVINDVTQTNLGRCFGWSDTVALVSVGSKPGTPIYFREHQCTYLLGKLKETEEAKG